MTEEPTFPASRSFHRPASPGADGHADSRGVAVRSGPHPRRQFLIAVLLFLATCTTTFLVGSRIIFLIGEPDAIQAVTAKGLWGTLIWDGLLYSLPVMSILLAHEMGHFLQARRWRMAVSPPYFIPHPFWPLGTFGAVIVQRGPAPNRRALFDVAVSGPLAGLVLALPITFLSLLGAEVAPVTPENRGYEFGEPLIFQWLARLALGPIPADHSIMMTSLMLAGWVGLLVTALNLLPIGQLDGGHILYALLGRRAHIVAQAMLAVAMGYMIWTGDYAYLLIVILIALNGIKHPPTLNDRVELGPVRTAIGWATLSFLIVGFTLNPLSGF